MVNPRQTIEMQGVEVELLLTPSLYKRSLTKGMDLTLHDATDAAEIWQVYVKHIYLAYLNSLDIAAYDGKKTKQRFVLADFEVWAAGEGKDRFTELLGVLVEFKTGKTLEELTKEAENKKKEPEAASPRRFRSWSRGSRGVTG